MHITKLKRVIWTITMLLLTEETKQVITGNHRDINPDDITSSTFDVTMVMTTATESMIPEETTQNTNNNTSTDNVPVFVNQNDVSTVSVHEGNSSAILNGTIETTTTYYATRSTKLYDVNNETLYVKTTQSPALMTISEYVSYVTTLLFLVMGIVGNALTISVMTSHEFSSMTTSIILIALALSDTTFLLMQPFTKLWLIQFFGVDIRAWSDASCKLFFTMLRIAKMCSSWFVVLVCLERLVAVWLPIKARIVCTKRNAFISICIVVAIIAVFNGFWSFSSRVIGGKSCIVNYSDPSIAVKSGVFAVVGTLLYAGIPTVLLCVMTPAVICRLTLHTKLRRKLSEDGSSNKQPTNNKTFAMLLSVMIAYIILATPIVICMNIAMIKGENLFHTQDATLSMMREIAQPLEVLNYSINFFLYVGCSAMFRGRVLAIMGCGKASRLEHRLSQRSFSGSERRQASFSK